MPDVITPPAAPAIPEGATSEQIFAHFESIDPNRTPAPEAPAAPTQETPPAVPAKAPEAKAGEIPEQFLTGKKKIDELLPQDEYDTLMNVEPQGQLKHEDWKRYKSAVGKKVDALTAQLKEREEKLQAAEKRGVPEDIQKKLEQYEKTIAEREAVLERIAVQESPKFKSQFTTKETAIAERLKRSGAELGLDVEQLDLAMKSSLKRRAEIMENLEMGETTRAALTGLMNQYDLLQDDKAEFLNQSKEVHARWQQEQQQAAEAQEKQRSEMEKSVFVNIGKEMRETFAPFQRVEGNDAWNAQAEAMEAEAEKYFNGQLPLNDLARVVYKGVGAAVQEQIIASLHKKLSDATEELAGLKRAQPGAVGSVPHQNGTPDDSHLSVEQRRMNTFNYFSAGGR